MIKVRECVFISKYISDKKGDVIREYSTDSNKNALNKWISY